MKLIKYIIKLILITSFLGLFVLVGGLYYLSNTVPHINSISDYRPKLPSKVYDRNGKLLATFGTEKRELVEISEIPKKVLNAFLAAEDSGFYEHSGIDLFGIARAFIANLKAGKVVQGGSTITQQVAKSFLSNKERSVVRKMKDIILAYKLEKKLSKEEILFLYLNQVYLGGGYYGVKTAFKGYFGKELSEVTTAEAAMVAGLLVAPSKYSPYKNPKFAYTRQRYVLSRLVDNKMISIDEYQKSLSEVIRYKNNTISKNFHFHFQEKVRLDLIKALSKTRLYEGGFEIVTSLDSKLQKVAQESVNDGLVEIDRRQGFDKGAIKIIPDSEREQFIKKQITEFFKMSSNFFTINFHDYERRYEYDLSNLNLNPAAGGIKLSDEVSLIVKDLFNREGFLKGLVTDVTEEEAKVIVGGINFSIDIRGVRWASERLIDKDYQYKKSPKLVTDVLEEGMIVYVRPLKVKNKKVEKNKLELFQIPKVQGAALALDPSNNEVVSLVGGGTFRSGHFNRAFQSIRQPGSVFKPFVYAAAIKAGLSPSSILFDTPESLDAGDHDINWKPRNYDGKYLGPITLRSSLEKSRNVTTIKLAQKIGMSNLITFLNSVGMNSGDRKDLSIVLGSQGVTLLDLVKSYAYFLDDDIRETSQIITSVKDYMGNDYSELFITSAVPGSMEFEEDVEDEALDENEGLGDVDDRDGQVLTDQERFIVKNLLRGVIKNGTGRKASFLSSSIGGKTGTTSNYIDAWFVGFSNKIALGVWTGFDDNKTLGYGESGSKAALPVWIDIMKEALRIYGDGEEDEVPEGIVNVLIDKNSGKLASLSTKKPFLEAFIEGTEPGADNEEEGIDDDLSDSPEKIDDEDFLNL